MTHMEQVDTEENGRNSNSTSGPFSKIRARTFSLTINNYDTNDIELLKSYTEANVVGFQSEVGTQGTQHLQIVLSFKNPRFATAVSAIWRRAHVEKARKPLGALVNYCKKSKSWDGRWRFLKQNDRVILNVTPEDIFSTAIIKKSREETIRELKKKLMADLEADFEKNPEDWLEAIQLNRGVGIWGYK